jgi:hypothetical protein
VASREGDRSDVNIEFAAAPGNDSLILKLQLQAAKGNFHSSGIFIITDEQIRHAQSK